jgi:hypothetical protein
VFFALKSAPKNVFANQDLSVTQTVTVFWRKNVCLNVAWMKFTQHVDLAVVTLHAIVQASQQLSAQLFAKLAASVSQATFEMQVVNAFFLQLAHNVRSQTKTGLFKSKIIF